MIDEIPKIASAFLNSNWRNIPRKLWVICHPLLWKLFHSTHKEEKKLIPYFQNKRGIRIGGDLRWIFQNLVRQSSELIDVNVVEAYLGEATKVDYNTDATNLYFARDNEFDFICSTHVLEHIADPIKALIEWRRVVKSGGVIMCGIPDKRFTFDHKRKRTQLRHLVNDYKFKISQYDMTHTEEFVRNWDEDMDWRCSKEQFLRNIRINPYVYTHFHVWTKEDLRELFKYVDLKVTFDRLIGDTVYVLGKKS
ncbi:class I SAM-dependent methyltransferase [Candidatus Bathyarchaeota archaeon A05DMB-2]|jgi:SAM-dependent methyltransferase|nr:class I SAM-dependent methyltransferase [Candidatus Bathyarchaeota archaeon A05DMB-2]